MVGLDKASSQSMSESQMFRDRFVGILPNLPRPWAGNWIAKSEQASDFSSFFFFKILIGNESVSHPRVYHKAPLSHSPATGHRKGWFFYGMLFLHQRDLVLEAHPLCPLKLWKANGWPGQGLKPVNVRVPDVS